MLRSESYFHGGQLDILAADFSAAGSVAARRLAALCVHLPELVVAEFVGDTIMQSGRSARSHIEVAAGSAKASLMRHVVRKNARSDAHWPQKLVDVVRRLSSQPGEDHQHVVHIQRL